MSSNALAKSLRIRRPAGTLCLPRVRSRTQSSATFRFFCESTQRIDEPHKERHPEIDWTSIAGMRNVLVHDYFEVDFETVWDVVARDLPPIERAMRTILTALD
jgi:uncharacterized protein with HEPN domain